MLGEIYDPNHNTGILPEEPWPGLFRTIQNLQDPKFRWTIHRLRKLFSPQGRCHLHHQSAMARAVAERRVYGGGSQWPENSRLATPLGITWCLMMNQWLLLSLLLCPPSKNIDCSCPTVSEQMADILGSCDFNLEGFQVHNRNGVQNMLLSKRKIAAA